MIRRSSRREQRPGDLSGLDDATLIVWPARYRRAHFDAVAGDTWNLSAARRTGQPCSTINTARRRRPSGVKGALA